jgi:DNA mismatch endonuclease Vsr
MKKPSKKISYNMSRIRSKGSAIERALASRLARSGMRGYEKNSASILGKPDFSWSKNKLAVFCDSSFWHGFKGMKTPRHKFRSNKKFWVKKICRNIERDKEVNKLLKKAGWKVLRFWDFQIVGDVNKCVSKITDAIK